ncbi:MAG: NAD(P)/FAD-dependent oxidoreductase [Oscillospiraceae bacterium]|nr:NAD(P)/FAD-dependent oxidoreductase [Oscillospiraceae bacterium]
MSSKNNPDVIIIGGGAAGMTAAIFAAGQNKRVLLIERNERLAVKLGITGKGRCNLTNNTDVQTLLKNVKTNPHFLQSAFNRFNSADTMAFFEELGVRLKTERGNRVFPVSDKAAEVVDALILRNNILGVNIINERAVSLIAENGVIAGVKCRTDLYRAAKVILATGGRTYPKTGSTGDGYKLAAALGHTIVKPKPSLVPLVTCENVSEMSGLSLKNVKLSLFAPDTGKLLYAEQGELVFTHFGISGPLALSASFYIDDTFNAPYKMEIDLKPALDQKKLDTRILRDFSENKNKQLQNALDALLPKSIIPYVISRANIQPDRRVNEISVAERRRLLEAVKGFTLTFDSFRPIDEAVITDGGIDTREINPKTMESKLIKGLHFAGEIIDVAAFTGGFNLQIAFSTAYAAATDI